MARIQLLEGALQHYDWGSRTALARLQGRPPAPRCEAELWFGTHPAGPGRVVEGGGSTDLRGWLAADPGGRLGARVVSRFGPELPFLLKLLAVERPLSLQVHPDAGRAREGYAREAGGSREASQVGSAVHRQYADARHKPELICALTRFRALAGFRPWSEVLSRLEAAGVDGVPGLPAFQASPAPETGRALLAGLLGLAPERVRELLRGAVTRLPPSDEDPSLAWLGRLAEAYPEDPAALAPLLLDHVELAPGEALFLPPGVLHCYLAGVAVEVMASSDNVVRGGLTSKPVHVEELLRLTDFEPRAARPLEPQLASPTEQVFAAPVEEFRLSRIVTGPGLEHRASAGGSLEILVCVEGEARIGGGPLLAPGCAAVVPAACAGYSIAGAACVYRVVVPVG